LGKPLFSRKEIDRKVKELAEEIARKYKGDRLLVIGVLKGAWIFMADLVRALNMEVFCDFVKVASYDKSTETSEKVCLLYWPDLDFSSERVLVLDDIADSGLTLSFLREKFKEEGAVSVEFCVLLDKPSRRKVAFKPDYVGFTIPDHFVVGYGMDCGERFRNLPYIEVYDDKNLDK
jgi:hypoxanthine phosphoribosyltransferase